MAVRLQRLSLSDVSAAGPEAVAARLRGLVPPATSVAESVAEIVARVRDQGDAAVLDYTRRLDTGGAEPRPLLVTAQELDEAIRTIPLEVVAGLQVAIANVAELAQGAVGDDQHVQLAQGQRIVVREIPVPAAAVYVPGGRAPYPSSVVMGVVTARAAGVLDVSVCAPPGPDGDVHPVILGTCRLCGVDTVYRMGGAQAVAALAHGTESVRRVDVIVGPGNLYVQEAKRQLSGMVGIDGFAGPSDLLVLAGAEAAPRLVALDLLAQAEHGPDSLVGVVSPYPPLLDAVATEVQALEQEYPGLPPAPCVLVDAADMRGALALANAFAPEHLELVGAEAEALAPLVQSAGALFVGAASGTAFGDYVAGSNHVLPTGGAARFASSLSARHFRRRMNEVHIGPAASKLAAAGAPLARAEGFTVHAASMAARVPESDASGGVPAPPAPRPRASDPSLGDN